MDRNNNNNNYEIKAISIRSKIGLVLMNTKSRIIKMKHAVKHQGKRIIQHQANYKDEESESQQTDQHDDQRKVQKDLYQQMLDRCRREYEQLKNDDETFQTIFLNYQQNGLNQFREQEQRQSLDFNNIKKVLHDVNDLYEDGKFKGDILNEIYASFYHLSLQPCGICLVQPKIHNIKILACGHAFCRVCLKQLEKTKRFKNRSKRCPFCRKQIEFPTIDLENQ